MSWKEGIFSLCSVGPSSSLSVSSESRKPLRAFDRSCHVTPLAKGNVNRWSCSEAPQWPLRRCGPDKPPPSPPSPLQSLLSVYRKRLSVKQPLCCGIRHDKLEFLVVVVKCLGPPPLAFKKTFIMIQANPQ